MEGCFAETPSRYLLEVDAADVAAVMSELGADATVIGSFGEAFQLRLGDLEVDLNDLSQCWRTGLGL